MFNQHSVPDLLKKIVLAVFTSFRYRRHASISISFSSLLYMCLISPFISCRGIVSEVMFILPAFERRTWQTHKGIFIGIDGLFSLYVYFPINTRGTISRSGEISGLSRFYAVHFGSQSTAKSGFARRHPNLNIVAGTRAKDKPRRRVFFLPGARCCLD